MLYEVITISASNLDEFYMVRVAGLKGQIDAGVNTPSDDGLTPEQQLAQINAEARVLVARQASTWKFLQEELRKEGVAVIEPKELTQSDRAWLADHFMGQIFV